MNKLEQKLLEERFGKMDPHNVAELFKASLFAQPITEVRSNAEYNGLLYFAKNTPVGVDVKKIPESYPEFYTDSSENQVYISDMCACGMASDLTEKNIYALKDRDVFHFVQDTGDLYKTLILTKLLREYNGKRLPIEKLESIDGPFYTQLREDFVKKLPSQYLDRLHIIPVMRSDKLHKYL